MVEQQDRARIARGRLGVGAADRLDHGQIHLLDLRLALAAVELEAVEVDAPQHAVADLPTDALMFLTGSRYCETDRLSDIAWSLFGTTPYWPAVLVAIVVSFLSLAVGVWAFRRQEKTLADVI